MAMPIYIDVAPEIEVSGELYTYIYAHKDAEQRLVLTRHAAMRLAQVTLRSLDEEPREALIVKLEAAAK